jgi:hypothetical protein
VSLLWDIMNRNKYKYQASLGGAAQVIAFWILTLHKIISQLQHFRWMCWVTEFESGRCGSEWQVMYWLYRKTARIVANQSYRNDRPITFSKSYWQQFLEHSHTINMPPPSNHFSNHPKQIQSPCILRNVKTNLVSYTVLIAQKSKIRTQSNNTE